MTKTTLPKGNLYLVRVLKALFSSLTGNLNDKRIQKLDSMAM